MPRPGTEPELVRRPSPPLESQHEEQRGMRDEPPVLVERRGPVTVITLNRPRVLNAVDTALAVDLGAALERVEDDRACRVGVLTGAGRAFCAGADLTALAAGRPVHDPAHPEWGFAGITRHPLRKPLIAAVNGLAYGGGLEISLTCDLVVAAAEATFALPEAARGLLAGAGGLVRLPQQVPFRAAMELALTGQPVTAETAAAWHLVNRVVPAGQALDAALELANQIAQNAPPSVQAGKRLIRAAVANVPEPQLWARNDAECAAVLAGGDAAEGMRAFVERRAPVWHEGDASADRDTATATRSTHA
jgi:crotonobetainyl-CoA hydratase